MAMRVKIGLGSCGMAAGARQTQAALDEALAAAGSTLRSERTGCIGLCFAEPLVEVVDVESGQNWFYGRVDAAAAARSAKCPAYYTPETDGLSSP